jgi:bifunctional DNA-binding transcriptional regulator/antitoxin component of YhaV-PrlF toxin-antitoxin module
MIASMTSVVITSKWQVTIPEAIRKELPSLAIGQRLRWEVVGGVLTAVPVRNLATLAGCLRSADMPVMKRQDEKAAIEQAKVEHYAKKSRKR